jgi:hypothetical protein
MSISPDEAEESLVAIQKVTQKTRRSIASSGAYIFLIITGVILLVGFLSTQSLPGETVVFIWVGMSLLGSAVSILLGARLGRRVRSPSTVPTAKRAGLFWLLLVFYCVATIAITRPTDGKQVTMLIILFIMVGQLAIGLLLSFSSSWWALPITALALVGYFLLADFFYLWMAILVGGGMIALGLYIHARW